MNEGERGIVPVYVNRGYMDFRGRTCCTRFNGKGRGRARSTGCMREAERCAEGEARFNSRCGAPWIHPFSLHTHPPTLQAALCGRVEVARVLISHGADSRAQDRSGNTAVHLAGLGGHLVLLSELLQVRGGCSGAWRGLTPLILSFCMSAGFRSTRH